MITRLSIVFSFILVLFVSCNKDYYSVGIEIFDQQFENLKSETFPVFSFQESLERVQTNNLSNVHLGKFKLDFFGETNSSFISQLDVSALQTFGDFNQELENEGSLTNIRVINEQEELTAVYLDLPFFNNTNDSDNDGVIDIYDADPADPESDSDGDGLSDIVEFQAGTNPLSNDSDGDGILDPSDSDNESYNPQTQNYEIDSVFGNRNSEFDLKVYELTYYLSALDPNNNFETTKQYFSDDDYYKKGYYGKTLHDNRISLNFDALPVLFLEDDPTTDIDELTQVSYFETPRIRVPLNTEFFQRYIVNMEGSEKLSSQSNFNNYFKGLIVRAENFSDDLYMLLDIFNARVVLEYDYNYYNANGTADDVSDDIIEIKKKTNIIPLGGVTINLYDQVDFNQKILSEVRSSAENIPTETVYLNGSKFISKLNLFSDDNSISSQLASFKSKDILINEANIILYLNENIHKSDYSFLPERLYIYSYEDAEPIEDYNKDFSIDYSTTSVNSNKVRFGGLLQYNSNNIPTSYKFNITNHISNIIRHDSLNITLGLTTSSNINDVSKKSGYFSDMQKLSLPASSLSLPFPVALYGSNPDQENSFKRIKLEVLYTEY